MKKYLPIIIVSFFAVLSSCDKEETSSDIVKQPKLPTSALSGVFTVSAGADSIEGSADDKKVHFSKGNLYCIQDSSNFTFAFEDQQYQYHTRYGNVHYDENYNTVTDRTSFQGIIYEKNQSGLFQWVSPNAAGASGDILSSYGAFSSLTLNQCIGNADDCVDFGQAMGSPWFTLSNEEWEYLINGRSNAANLVGWAVVNGVTGTVIAPDNWNFESSPICVPGQTKEYNGEEWTEAESNGLVFLPAAGYYGQSGKRVYYVRGYSCYWSLTAAKAGGAFAILFNPGSYEWKDDGRRNGYSVRLVCLED